MMKPPRVLSRMKATTLAALLLAALPLSVHADDGYAVGSYVPETDPLVVRKLEQWQDWKFGFMMHWGAYSQWGVVESWSICSEDVDWCGPPKHNTFTAKYAYPAGGNIAPINSVILPPTPH